MRIGESTFVRLPEHLQKLFRKLPNHGSEEVVGCFPESAGQQGDVRGTEPSKPALNVYGGGYGRHSFVARNDSGSAARFFYSAKADTDDRLGSRHPTIKPVDLMQYLIRLITPPDGTVLDPFAGTGTVGEAAWREGMRAVLIEQEAQYIADIERRMSLVLAGPDERARESLKARGQVQGFDDLPLFAASAASPEWEAMWAEPFGLTPNEQAERKAQEGGDG